MRGFRGTALPLRLHAAQGTDSALSYHKGYEYSRTNNPTRAAFEMALAGAEGGKHGEAPAEQLGAGGAPGDACKHAPLAQALRLPPACLPPLPSSTC